jgi:hypothetical protein
MWEGSDVLQLPCFFEKSKLKIFRNDRSQIIYPGEVVAISRDDLPYIQREDCGRNKAIIEFDFFPFFERRANFSALPGDRASQINDFDIRKKGLGFFYCIGLQRQTRSGTELKPP